MNPDTPDDAAWLAAQRRAFPAPAAPKPALARPAVKVPPSSKPHWRMTPAEWAAESARRAAAVEVA